MPELPEVEVLRRELTPVLVGQRILEAHIADPHLGVPKGVLEGKTILALERLGKYLLFPFEEGGCLVVHLGMTGQLEVTKENAPRKHERARFVLSSGTHLSFIDPRRFGKISLLDAKETLQRKLGIDPYSPDFTFSRFQALLEGRKRLKDFLLDQRNLAGIGNIYASEILFWARLHPRRSINSLSLEEQERLFKSIRKVLDEAIAAKGTTIRDFRRPGGESGGFQNLLSVYGKTECPRCKGPVVREVLSSRSTYFCPQCQPLA
ncbi:MAG: bifunctional DNA-formamidopyrimidine glycosylase/DNA-(apurinic or apyrimidinic site) lyase [Candidatus Caldatribacterium sp.]|nr:bifunctional DNA-formamidopyrimidine glycosylase/DNA-(apurinic or apyrimidinic site) lyase [Candidatus Caldatribacterium sp.]MDW8081909.1 bifunctional DNA-formamidopyrimidine glycosylase/DNA-(apurinic or apyrimidinic site) lyase [Candidatus Calescibacterium sp.]